MEAVRWWRGASSRFESVTPSSRLSLSLLLYHTPYDGRWDGRQRQHQRLRAAHAATATNEFFLESTIVFVIFLVLPLQQFKCL